MPVRFKLYTILVANSVLIYDHMATITDEITFIWCRPKALSAILFLINRYVALLGNVCMLSMYLLPIMSHEVLWFRYARTQLAGSHLLSAEVSTLVLSMCCFSQQRPSCRTYFTSKDLLFFFQQIFVCFILTLRTYALYCRNKRLLTLMIIIVCALAGVTVGTFGLRSSAVVPGLNCLDSYAKYIAVSPGLQDMQN
ncbi:hypothetical protein BDR06DRAFT_775529 [Suillus hirtellus]|nr:hypothetical protein BDR06DRAFT_775529 [Suillus hirtellus]